MIPQDVPGIVARLQDDIRTPAYRAYLNGILQGFDDDFDAIAKRHPDHKIKRRTNLESGDQFAEILSGLLNITPLYHVTEPMAAVARHAAEQIEDDQLWLPDSWPSLCGVLFYQRPLMLADVWNRPVTVAAMLWYTANNPDGKPGVSTVLFADARDIRDYYNEVLAIENPGWSSALGRFHVFESDWMPYGMAVGTWEHSYPDELAQEYMADHPAPVVIPGHEPTAVPLGTPSTVNLGRINYAIFQLMSQTLADISEVTDKRLARRNRGKKRPPHTVTVIQLRRREQYGYHEEGTGRWLTYRSITRGHWRRQPYGPRNDPQYRRIYIHPFVRGPEGAPFHQTKRVATLKR